MYCSESYVHLFGELESTEVEGRACREEESRWSNSCPYQFKHPVYIQLEFKKYTIERAKFTLSVCRHTNMQGS